MIDNESQKEIIRIKKLKEEDAKNTQDLIAWQNNAEKQLKELSKVVSSLNKDKDRLEKKISVAEKKNGADSKEVKDMRIKLSKIEQSTKAAQKRMAGYKGQKAMLEKQGIKSGMSVQKNEDGEYYALDEESTKEYNQNKKRLEKNKIKKDLEEAKLKDKSSNSYEKMNKVLSSVTRAFGIFKVALLGFAAYKAISTTLKAGAAATNTAVRSAMRADITAEHAMALQNMSKSLALRDDFMLDLYISSKNIKDRFAQLGGQLTPDEMKALGAAGITADSIQQMTSSDFTIKAFEAIEKVFKSGEIHKANRMADLLFGGDAKMLLAAKQSNIIYKDKKLSDMVAESLNISNMPAGFKGDMDKYNKQLAEFETRIESLTQVFWNLWQNALEPILRGANYFLDWLMPSKETRQKDLEKSLNREGKTELQNYKDYFGMFGGGTLFRSAIDLTKENATSGARYGGHTGFIGGLISMTNSQKFTGLNKEQQSTLLNEAFSALEKYGVKDEKEIGYVTRQIDFIKQKGDPEFLARLENTIGGYSGEQYLQAAKDTNVDFNTRRDWTIAAIKALSGMNIGGYVTSDALTGNQGAKNTMVTIRLETIDNMSKYILEKKTEMGNNVTLNAKIP